jgi:hypothetical protein
LIGRVGYRSSGAATDAGSVAAAALLELLAYFRESVRTRLNIFFGQQLQEFTQNDSENDPADSAAIDGEHFDALHVPISLSDPLSENTRN